VPAAADSLAALGSAPAPGLGWLALKTALLLGLLLAALWALARWRPRLRSPGGGRPLEVLSALSLGPRRQAVLLRAGGRVLLVGLGEGGPRTLGRFSPAEAEQLIAQAQGGARPFRARMVEALGEDGDDGRRG